MKSQSYHNFWQRIHQAAKNKGFPLRVMFELTYRCNFQCKHCYVPQSYRKYKELETKEVLSILDQLKDMGCFYLGFTGGEPFIREDMIEILWYAKRSGFEIIIYTNGSLINENIAGQLGQLRPNKVDITIPAMSKDAFERISGAPGSRDRVFRAIDLLNKKRVNLGFKTCVLKENEKEIEEIQDFASSLGALHRLDDILSPRLDGSKEPYRYRGKLLNANERESNANSRECHISVNSTYRNFNSSSRARSPGRSALAEPGEGVDSSGGHLPAIAALKALQAGGVTAAATCNSCQRPKSCAISENSRLFKCGVGVSQAAITPSGELKMCVMIDYPKHEALKSSLKDAWQKLKESVKNIKPDKNYRCAKCELEPYCKWCPARGWLENRDFTSCEPESRRWAEIRKKTYGDRGQTQNCRYSHCDAK